MFTGALECTSIESAFEMGFEELPLEALDFDPQSHFPSQKKFSQPQKIVFKMVEIKITEKAFKSTLQKVALRVHVLVKTILKIPTKLASWHPLKPTPQKSVPLPSTKGAVASKQKIPSAQLPQEKRAIQKTLAKEFAKTKQMTRPPLSSKREKPSLPSGPQADATQKQESLKHKERAERREEKEQQQHQEQEEEEKIEPIEKVGKTKSEGGGAEAPFKPVLSPPQLDIFALYYILDKMGLISESNTYVQHKQEIETVDAETTTAHQKMLEEMKKALKKERETQRWGVAMKVFSWMGSVMGVIAGVALIATGIGAVAGAMLIAGGVITIANQLMEITGGWRKVAEMLPSDDPDQRRAVVAWMQIAITVLSLILCLVGMAFGGYSAVGEGMNVAMQLFEGVAVIGGGVTNIGKGISEFLYSKRRGEQKKIETRLSTLKHIREDLLDHVNDTPDRLEQLFESLTNNLSLTDEINSAYQGAWR